MAKYKAYPEYKDSGVEWLGKVPLNWQIHSLKRAVDGCTNGVWGEEPDDKHDLIVLRVADFDRQSFKISDLKLTTRSILPKDRGSRLLKQGDLLIEKSGGGDKTLVGCVVLFDKKYEAVTSNFVAKMTPRDSYDGHFLTYAFSQLYAGKVNYPSIKQTTGIQNLDADAYLMEKFCFPPKHEQRNIAGFLDHETAKIDNLIAKQQQLIELLKEKRQAVISHAVTKGLNPDVPMKDSGVEWLGEVPEHWTIKRLKHIAPKVGVGLVINPSTYTKDEGVYFIFGGDVKEFGFDLTKTRRISPQDSNKLLPSRLNSRDLVSVRVGYPGITSVVTDDLEGSNCASIIIIRRGSYNSDWLCAAMNVWVGRQQVDLASYGAAQKQFNVSDAIEFVFPVPPINEQNDIAYFVQKTLKKFDDLTQKALKQIELLQERRTALISSAVTGKIDVRDWVAPEKQENEEPQEATA
ncbi:restriction endonuclease subunit S [Pantoea ananatis]|uniref:restriction endonuclease subunit S n=1 Tax=Pantoea ananas TaxID=553 RepID=UPI0002417398|nr:restriction endonuclease subunit S [Pantoea ananatis]UEG17600.1 restriction endonuclease subunit S [Pantoea ananatis]CCF11166.1 type I restriction-modification system specificity subunit S [Pantoea ananatis LMG 5342]